MSKTLWTNRKPTASELAEQQEAARAEAELARDTVLRKALEEEADPLFFKWQRGEADKAAWLDKVAEVRARFDQPSA